MPDATCANQEPPAPTKRKRHSFTSETARLASNKGHATQSAIAKLRNERLEARRQARLNGVPLPSKGEPISVNSAGCDPLRAESYDGDVRLLRARLRTMAKPSDIRAMAAAVEILEGLRCQYAGIPKPGSLRPRAIDPRARRASTPAIMDASPAPAPVVAQPAAPKAPDPSDPLVLKLSIDE